jgi:hypothetical protein
MATVPTLAHRVPVVSIPAHHAQVLVLRAQALTPMLRVPVLHAAAASTLAHRVATLRAQVLVKGLHAALATAFRKTVVATPTATSGNKYPVVSRNFTLTS